MEGRSFIWKLPEASRVALRRTLNWVSCLAMVMLCGQQTLMLLMSRLMNDSHSLLMSFVYLFFALLALVAIDQIWQRILGAQFRVSAGGILPGRGKELPWSEIRSYDIRPSQARGVRILLLIRRNRRRELALPFDPNEISEESLATFVHEAILPR